MRRCSVKFCSQAFTIVLCMSASQLSGKEAIKGWGEPSCAGPRHVEEEVGSREWWGQTPHTTLNTTLWKRNWQPQINSTFQWIISSFGRKNPPLPSLFPLLPSPILLPLYPRSPLYPLPTIQTLFNTTMSGKKILAVPHIFPIPPTHLHLIKTSEITHKCLGVWNCADL